MLKAIFWEYEKNPSKQVVIFMQFIWNAKVSDTYFSVI